jgi:hypothetical protein
MSRSYHSPAKSGRGAGPYLRLSSSRAAGKRPSGPFG